MNALFENLLFHEQILLILGLVLFAILCIGLIRSIVRDKPMVKYVPVFLLPVLMIAYPSIKEINYNDFKIVVNETIEKLNDNPESVEIHEELDIKTQKLIVRAKSPDDFVLVSRAYIALGNTDEAMKYAKKAKLEGLKRGGIAQEPKVAQETNGSPVTVAGGSTTENDIRLIETKPQMMNVYTKSILNADNLIAVTSLEKAIKDDPSILANEVKLNQKFSEYAVSTDDFIFKDFKTKHKLYQGIEKINR